MATSSEIILSNQTHPYGNDVLTVISSPVKGDGFYGRSDGLHTVQINLIDFVGKIEIQGTLTVEPAEADWFPIGMGSDSFVVDTTGAVTSTSFSYVNYTSETTSSKVYNFTGNYVWIRASVSQWTRGTIENIMLNH